LNQKLSGSERRFVIAVYGAQFFLGGWFLFHGANHWLQFFPQPPGSSSVSGQLIGALIRSGLFDVVKLIEVVAGIMLLANRAVPLATVIGFPVTLSIAHLNIAVNGDPFSLATGVIIIALHSLVALGHLDKYAPMLVVANGDPSSRGLRDMFGKGEARQ